MRRRQWQPIPVLLPGKSHWWRSLGGCSPWGHDELDMTERLHFHFSLSCIGEGNGNPLQCSCLKNPRDRGAWWAAVYGVAQSRTQLQRLSSSSSKKMKTLFHTFKWVPGLTKWREDTVLEGLCFRAELCHSAREVVILIFLLWRELTLVDLLVPIARH